MGRLRVKVVISQILVFSRYFGPFGSNWSLNNPGCFDCGAIRRLPESLASIRCRLSVGWLLMCMWSICVYAVSGRRSRGCSERLRNNGRSGMNTRRSRWRLFCGGRVTGRHAVKLCGFRTRLSRRRRAMSLSSLWRTTISWMAG